MKILQVILILLLGGCSSMESKYQHDMDRVRITHIDYLHTLIQEYLIKSGRLPLQENIKENDIQVYITHSELPGWLIEQSKKLPIESYPSKKLELDIERVLARDINMPSDPQNIETYAPNVYIYMVTSEWACVAAHLYSPTPKTRNVQDRYYKYELCTKHKA